MTLAYPQRVAWLIVALVFIVHLVIAPRIPLGVDEAHYALYALHPALSYFDHPPLVGWLQMLVAPLGYSELSIRLIPAVLFTSISLYIFRLVDLLYPTGPRYQALVAVCLLNTAPLLQLLGWGLVPDLPLMLLALVAMELVLRLYRGPRWCDWLWLGLVYGLAGLSKYTAVFLPLGTMLFMTQQQGLKWLKQPGPWLAAFIALLCISPILIWNACHDWASFNYQLNHAVGHGWRLQSALTLQGVQMLCYSVLTYIGGITASVFAWRRGKVADWLVLWHAWPFLLTVSISAGNGAMQPNWPAVSWTLLVPLIAHWLCTVWHQRWVKVLTLLSSTLAVGLIVFIVSFLAWQPLSQFPFMVPAVRDLIGWDAAAARGKALLATLKPKDGRSPVLLVDNWSRASRIAWYARPLPVQVLSGQTSQFSYWFGNTDDCTRGILIRANKAMPPAGVLQTQGLTCHLIEQQDEQMDGVTVNRFHFYQCGIP